jgi:tyrosyl-tRNA synthetase
MSFAEFSYPLLQAWDWWTLFQKGTQVQVGGADQYGNILFGMDAVKAISRNTAIEIKQNPLESELDRPIGFTTPLLTAPSGEKFGKSAGNAIWLDKDMTSTFELYQVSLSPLLDKGLDANNHLSSSSVRLTTRWSVT